MRAMKSPERSRLKGEKIEIAFSIALQEETDHFITHIKVVMDKYIKYLLTVTVMTETRRLADSVLQITLPSTNLENSSGSMQTWERW